MKSSSGQNSPRNGNDSQAQTLSEEETRENDDPEAREETTESKKSNEDAEGTESNVAPTCDSLPNTSNVEQNVSSSGTDPNTSSEARTADADVLGASLKGLPVVLTYAARNRPRQPFFTDHTSATTPASTSAAQPRQPRDARPAQETSGGRVPPPPPYYPNRDGSNTAPVHRQPSTQRNEQKTNRYYVPDPMNPMINPFTNVVVWAPYPSKIPHNVPAYLSHLVDAEAVFVVQHLEAIEFFASLDLPNIYFIQNNRGESIYYVYESTLLEVYSPPSVPIGAVVKHCHPFREHFHILDADENVMFKLYGDCSLMYCSRCIQYDFSIRTLDDTEIGFIRRDFPGMYQFLMGTEYYGVSFPKNMDVKIKAVLLGALFLIDFLYFE